MARLKRIPVCFLSMGAEPIDGRISRRMVDVGNLVGDGKATLLGIVVTQKPVYAYFYVSEPQWLMAEKNAEKRRMNLVAQGKLPKKGLFNQQIGQKPGKIKGTRKGKR